MSSRGLSLVIEDDQDISELIALILSGAGFEVEPVASGVEGLRTAAVLQPDLITLDVGLPDMDGRDVARGLLIVCTAPIIMITAHAGVDMELEGMAAGAIVHLIKPFRPGELRALADRLCP
ncbi:DNA-binding response OmpR family regulator [Pseudarthrobacter sp. PvP004]|uniref:response regulator transcription factor n=1 Tax=Pseudarthrobacter sp. PvP004 TaxID=2817850 RepID=UPI001AE5E612|nr:response regulator transcription factor [Pseudarthrobacter sp. PvP004]MBP2269267.1 DNA-binding response OmpR family regulator [Pseudarthrobacter sp. PvP004]